MWGPLRPQPQQLCFMHGLFVFIIEDRAEISLKRLGSNPDLSLSGPQSPSVKDSHTLLGFGGVGRGSAQHPRASGTQPLGASVFLSENGNDYSSWLLELGVGVRVTEGTHIHFQGSLGTTGIPPQSGSYYDSLKRQLSCRSESNC